MTDNSTHPDPNRLWRHRRTMAYSGLVFSAVAWVAGFIASVVIPAHAQAAIHPLISTGFWGGLIPMATYMGNNAVENVAAIKAGK